LKFTKTSTLYLPRINEDLEECRDKNESSEEKKAR